MHRLEATELFSTPEKLQDAQARLLSGNPSGTSELLTDYFDYCATELDRITDGLQLPAVLFHKLVTTSAEVTGVYEETVDILKAIARDQGKSCFWVGNQNLEDAFIAVTEARIEAEQVLFSAA